MATAQDMEHRQMFLNSSGSSASQRGTQIAEARGSPSQLRVEVTVAQAHNVPHIKKQFGLKRRFFVTVASGATVKKTKSARIDGQTMHWGQTLEAL